MIKGEIGEAAGAVWRYLDTHGETTVTKLKQGIGLADPVLLMAIGWLAREGKIGLSRDKRTIKVRLDA